MPTSWDILGGLVSSRTPFSPSALTNCRPAPYPIVDCYTRYASAEHIDASVSIHCSSTPVILVKARDRIVVGTDAYRCCVTAYSVRAQAVGEEWPQLDWPSPTAASGRDTETNPRLGRYAILFPVRFLNSTKRQGSLTIYSL